MDYVKTLETRNLKNNQYRNFPNVTYADIKILILQTIRY